MMFAYTASLQCRHERSELPTRVFNGYPDLPTSHDNILQASGLSYLSGPVTPRQRKDVSVAATPHILQGQGEGIPRLVITEASPSPAASPTLSTASTISPGGSLEVLCPTRKRSELVRGPPSLAESRLTGSHAAEWPAVQRAPVCSRTWSQDIKPYPSDPSDKSPRWPGRTGPGSDPDVPATPTPQDGHPTLQAHQREAASRNFWEKRIQRLERAQGIAHEHQANLSGLTCTGAGMASHHSVQKWPRALDKQAALPPPRNAFVPPFKSGSYFTPWELRDKSLGCSEHGPRCVRRVDSTVLRQQVDVVGTTHRKRQHARVKSEPILHVRPPQPDKRKSSIADGLERTQSAVRFGEVEGRAGDKSQCPSKSHGDEEAALRQGLATEWDEIQHRMSRSAEPTSGRWLTKFFWDGDDEDFEPAMEELRRASTDRLLPPHRNLRAKAVPREGDMLNSETVFQDELQVPLGSPVWRGIKQLVRTSARWAADSLKWIKTKLHRLQHRAKHRFLGSPCTADCSADAFERDSMLRGNGSSARTGSYGTLDGSLESQSHSYKTFDGLWRPAVLRQWCNRSLHWIISFLDSLDGTCTCGQRLEALGHAEHCHGAVNRPQRKRQTPSTQRPGGVFRWVQLPKHGWVYERYA